MQEVLELVRTSAADFDAVCMATALHKMASLNADPQQYQLLADRPELTRLKDLICKLHVPILEHTFLPLWWSHSATYMCTQADYVVHLLWSVCAHVLSVNVCSEVQYVSSVVVSQCKL